MNRPHRRRLIGLAMLALLTAAPAGTAADPPAVAFERKPGKVEITVAGQALGTYVYQDATISRPYFAHLRAPGGIPVTRNHPPIKGQDATDHGTFHPGLWLAFGDLSGADGWRNRARVQHDGFAEKPQGGPGRGTFTVRNLYLSADGAKVICRETCRYTILVRPAGYLLLWDSEFRSDQAEFAFGDQEEMGLGVRLATPLTVKQGGRIRNSAGDQDERQVRGKPAEWCDYSGVVEGRRVGVALMPAPDNFRPSWFHARDYGLLVANPFGRKALGRGEASRVVVPRGEPFRLRFGILIHASPADKPIDLDAARKDYLAELAREKR